MLGPASQSPISGKGDGQQTTGPETNECFFTAEALRKKDHFLDILRDMAIEVGTILPDPRSQTLPVKSLRAIYLPQADEEGQPHYP